LRMIITCYVKGAWALALPVRFAPCTGCAKALLGTALARLVSPVLWLPFADRV